MINGFERETADLSDYERDTLLPVMVKCLERKTGKEKAITNKLMCEGMNNKGYEIDEIRIRKIINAIRINGDIPCLMANNKGYYITDSREEMVDYITSLKKREDAIRAVREAMIEQLDAMPRKCPIDNSYRADKS